MNEKEAKTLILVANLLKLIAQQRRLTKTFVALAFAQREQEPARLLLIKELEASQSLEEDCRTLLAELTGARVSQSDDSEEAMHT